MYIDKLADIVNEYNNTYHSTIKIKDVDIKSSTYIDFNKESDKENLRFKNGDLVKISKYKNIFANIFKNTVLSTYVEKKFLKLFMKKNCKKQTKQSL